MNEKNILTQSIYDFITPKMLKYATLPFIITVIVMFIIFFIIAGIGIEQLHLIDIENTQTYMQDGIPHTESFTAQLQGLEVVKFLMSFVATSWLTTLFIYVIGGFLTIYFSIFVAVIIIGFLTPVVLRELQKRHYSDVEMIGYSNILFSLLNVLKWTLIMLLLFILLIPFYFIPFVNIIAFNIPLYYFFHKMLLFDISSNICTEEEDKQIRYFSKNSLRAKTLGLYIISLIPFVIFFTAIFYLIYLGHSYFIEVRNIRNRV